MTGTNKRPVGLRLRRLRELPDRHGLYGMWLLITTLTLLLAMAFPSDAQVKPATDEKIMVYGDSLSAAYGISPAQGWVSLMETRLKSRQVSVINASISGETTHGGLNRLSADLARHRPTIVLLALGANDGLRGLPVAETRRNLLAMIKLTRKANARPVLVGIQIPPNYGFEYAASFRNMFQALAREQMLTLVPFLLDGIAENLDNFQADRLHPTAAAQPRILANVLPVLERELNRTKRKP